MKKCFFPQNTYVVSCAACTKILNSIYCRPFWTHFNKNQFKFSVCNWPRGGHQNPKKIWQYVPFAFGFEREMLLVHRGPTPVHFGKSFGPYSSPWFDRFINNWKAIQSHNLLLSHLNNFIGNIDSETFHKRIGCMNQYFLIL